MAMEIQVTLTPEDLGRIMTGLIALQDQYADVVKTLNTMDPTNEDDIRVASWCEAELEPLDDLLTRLGYKL